MAFIEEAEVGDECLVGVGARVLNGARLFPGAVVAAGAVVLGGVEVPTGFRAQGVPAEVVPSTHPDRDYIVRGAARYRDMALRLWGSDREYNLIS
jgi:carbonic anhydrase/acetyltransferase-like protein (isoleucine patch superfamily)